MASSLSLKEGVAKGWKLFVVHFNKGRKMYIAYDAAKISNSVVSVHKVPKNQILSDGTKIGTISAKSELATHLEEFAKKHGREVRSLTELLAT